MTASQLAKEAKFRKGLLSNMGKECFGETFFWNSEGKEIKKKALVSLIGNLIKDIFIQMNYFRNRLNLIEAFSNRGIFGQDEIEVFLPGEIEGIGLVFSMKQS